MLSSTTAAKPTVGRPKKKTTHDGVMYQGKEGTLTFTSAGLAFRSVSTTDTLRCRVFWGIIKGRESNRLAGTVTLTIKSDEEDEEEEIVVFSAKDISALPSLEESISEYLRFYGQDGALVTTAGPNANTGTKKKIPVTISAPEPSLDSIARRELSTSDASALSSTTSTTLGTIAAAAARPKKHKNLRLNPAETPGVVMVSAQNATSETASATAATLHGSHSSTVSQGMEKSSNPRVQRKGLRGNHHHNQGSTEPPTNPTFGQELSTSAASSTTSTTLGTIAAAAARPKKHKNLHSNPAETPGVVMVSAQTATSETVSATANLHGSHSSTVSQGMEDSSSNARVQRKGLRGNRHHNQGTAETTGRFMTTTPAVSPTASIQTNSTQSARHGSGIPSKGLRDNQGVDPSRRVDSVASNSNDRQSNNRTEEERSSPLPDMETPVNPSIGSSPSSQPDVEVTTSNGNRDPNASPSREPSSFLVEATLVTEESRRSLEERQQHLAQIAKEESKILVEAHEVQMTDLFGDRRLQLLLLAGCLSVIGVIVALAIVLPSRVGGNGEEQTISTQEEAKQVAQKEATKWLEAYPEQDDLPKWRRDQLFALASTAYAVNVPDWLNYNETECNWPLPDLSGDPDCEEGRYHNLSLAETNTKKTGFIPTEVSLLTSLVLLDMSSNLLSGSIPSQIGLLSMLKWLHLSVNSLEGTIPLELFLLTRLETLLLDGRLNKISGRLASEFGQLTRLKELALIGNSLTGPITSQFGQMRSLEKLELSDNQLVGSLPSQLGLLTKLSVLRLNGNDGLWGPLPPEVEHLRKNLDTGSIEALDEVGRQRAPTSAPKPGETLPPALDQPATFAPNSLVYLDYFVSLNLTAEGVFDDPSSPQYQAARWLVDEDTYMTTEGLNITDPKILQRYGAATFYYSTLGNNWKLCGKKSPSCGDIAWLSGEDECKWFSLSCEGSEGEDSIVRINFPATGNDLIGEFPHEVSLLTGLKHFIAPENSLKGDLDVAFAGLTSLQSVAMPDNLLEGTIPTGFLSSNPDLRLVDLGGNLFSGPIPTDIAGATKLSDLQMNGNLLSGTIPTEIGKLTLLNNLLLQTNDLVGTIPEELFL